MLFSEKKDAPSPQPKTDAPKISKLETPFKAKAIIVIGACGSGKSTWVDKVGKERLANATIIDADLVKEQMPEYKEGIRKGDPNIAVTVHSKSLEKRNELFQETVNDVNNLVYLGTGTALDFYKQKVIGSLKKAGYHVTMVCVKTDLDKAIERCAKRALDTGRAVPEQAIRDSHAQAYQNFQIYKDLVHYWELYDNDGKGFDLKTTKV